MATVRIIKNRPLVTVKSGKCQIWHRPATNEHIFIYVPPIITADDVITSHDPLLVVFYYKHEWVYPDKSIPL